MEGQALVDDIRARIERAAGQQVELNVDTVEPTRVSVDLALRPPRIVLGAGIYEYPGFVHLGTEYAVACLRARRTLGELEFHTLLRRN